MALVLPLLVALTLGIIAFGHAFHVQTMLDNAARDAVRIYTLTEDDEPDDIARQVAVDSAQPSVALATTDVHITPNPCAPGADARVAIPFTFQLLGGFFGDITLTGSGTMRCNG
jgi:Flp pilus assembly protein TadG